MQSQAPSLSVFLWCILFGTPPRAAQEKHMFLHHTLGTGDYHVFSRIHKEITIAQADLIDPDKTPAEIDRVLRACYVDSRPVYIQLPTDMVTKSVYVRLLDRELDLTPSSGAEEAENNALQQILQRLYSAERPTVLVDAGVQRHRIIPQTDALVRKLNISTFTTPMGKSAVDESLPNFVGVYAGAASHPDV
jgi:pyruvate decarboxylase